MSSRGTLFAVTGAVLAALVLLLGMHAAARRKTVSGYWSSYEGDVALPALVMALKGQESVVMLGSSELTHTRNPAIAYKFLPETLGRPVFAFGHAGMQHAAILAQLLAYAGDLEGARIVVMVGPGWFLSRTHPESFLEFTPRYVAAKILVNRAAYPEAFAHLKGYAKANEASLTGLSPFLDILLDQGNAADYVTEIVGGYVSYWLQLTQFLTHFQVGQDHLAKSPKGPDWIGLIAAGNDRQRKISQNNDAFVDDAYLRKYITTWKGSGSPDLEIGVPDLDGPEMKDFLALVDFLKKAKARPLFVLQGFNGLAYRGLSKWPTLIGRLKSKLDESGMPCLDLWESVQQPSSYADIQHLGVYNWAQVDRGIERVFFGAGGPP